jgi:exopolysaccharide biosynthesis WecB/TagA/CpsF family protein
LAVSTWVVASAALAAYVIVGLVAARAPRAAYVALAWSPIFVLSTLRTRLAGLLRFDPTSWVRTPRAGEAAPDGRPWVGGVPIDGITLLEAVDRADAAVRDRRFLQVCTVNLDFLVNARRHESVRALLRASELNLADGAPVVWLMRALGRRIPGRVAGADFVPAICERAAERGHRVFLLGGENGSAARAASELVRRHPRLQIAGVLEPPRARLEQMDSVGMLHHIYDVEADIVLVAFGHPKQDRWIAANRHRMSASVAVGVGCTFDVLAGDRRRAPSWMREHGLEWLFRLANEPRRLVHRYLVDGCWLLAVLLPVTLATRLRMSVE